MRATNRTWLFTPWTREVWLRPRPQEAHGTERYPVRRERSQRRFERRLRDPPRASGSCSPPTRRWACLIRRGPAEGEEARRVAGAVGVRGGAEARAALAAAGVQGGVVGQAAPGAAGALEVRAAEKGVEAPEAERGVEAPEAERTAAECRTRTSTIPRMVSRGPSFRRFPRQ